MLEDGLGGGGAKHDGHDAAGASATRATEDVGAEGPLEELARGWGAGAVGRAAAGMSSDRMRSWTGWAETKASGQRERVLWHWGQRRRSSGRGWTSGAGRARRDGGGRPPEAGRGGSARRGRAASSGRRGDHRAGPRAARGKGVHAPRRSRVVRGPRRRSRESRCWRGARSPPRRRTVCPDGAPGEPPATCVAAALPRAKGGPALRQKGPRAPPRRHACGVARGRGGQRWRPASPPPRHWAVVGQRAEAASHFRGPPRRRPQRASRAGSLSKARPWARAPRVPRNIRSP